MVSGRRTTEYRCHQGVNCVEKRLSNSESYPAVFPQVAETAESLDTENRIWIMTNPRNNASGINVFSSHTYTFDALSRRDTSAREDTTKWDYDYNDRSEPKSAGADAGRLPSGSPQGADTVGRWQRQLTSGKKLLSSCAMLAGTATDLIEAQRMRELDKNHGGHAAPDTETPGFSLDPVSGGCRTDDGARNILEKLPQHVDMMTGWLGGWRMD